MKSKSSFCQSLEKYGQSLARRSPLPYTWVGVGLVFITILISILNVKNSVVGAASLGGVIKLAAERGDYELARQLYEAGEEKVLGAESELEDKVYPGRVVERRIAELEEKLKIYPGNRDIYLMLGELYTQAGEEVRANEYREEARILDPNN